MSRLVSTDLLAIAVAGAAFFVSMLGYIKSNAAGRTQVFLEFRNRFSELKRKLPCWYDSACIPSGADDAELRELELYWQNAFDEWFVTNRLEGRHFRRLWRRFYSGTLELSLRNGALRQVAGRLTHEGTEFGAHQETFRRVMNELCHRSLNEPLCGDRDCARCSRRPLWTRLTA